MRTDGNLNLTEAILYPIWRVAVSKRWLKHKYSSRLQAHSHGGFMGTSERSPHQLESGNMA